MFPYYGGKAKMAPLICSLLNYDDSDIFVTPFGGACRALLNKPRHRIEVYNDLTEGLCTFVEQMSNHNTAMELIHRIYETEYSQEQFDWALNIKNSVEEDFLTRTSKALNDFLKQILVRYKFISPKATTNTIKSILRKEDTQIMEQLKEKMTESELKKLKALNEDWIAVNEVWKEQGSLDIPRNLGVDISDIDLAVATYVIYMQSRDAMGKHWSNTKFKSTDAYRNQMKRLYDVAERLEGVQVCQIDAMDFFKHYFESDVQCKELEYSDNIEDIEYGFYLMNKWITNPRVMMLCDPSYISPEDEKKILEKRKEKNGDEQTKAKKDKSPKNLGTVYKASFDYEAHEYFVKAICNAKCKMLVCNYDLILYNAYLTEDKGWKRIEFETTTSVGGKVGNRRNEIIWYNY